MEKNNSVKADVSGSLPNDLELERALNYAFFIRRMCIKHPDKHSWKTDREIIDEVIETAKSQRGNDR